MTTCHLFYNFSIIINLKNNFIKSFIIKKRIQREYALSEIGNMGETPVFFNMVTNLTIEGRGAKTVKIRTT